MTTSKVERSNNGTVGDTVKRLRTACGMTPEQLGLSAQLSPSFIRKLEGGRRNDITLDTARKLADGLGVSPTVFFEAASHKASPLLIPPANPQATKQLLQWNICVQMGIAAVLDEHERLRLLADAAPDGIIVLEKGRVLFVNKALMEMLGLSNEAENLSGLDLQDLESLRKYVAPSSLADAHRSANNPSYTPFTLDLLRPDGSSVTVWIKGKDTEYAGRTVHVAILRDLSWQKDFDVCCEDAIDWEAALPDLVTRGLVSAQDLETQAMIIYTVTRVLYANEKAASLTGVADPKALIGQMPLSLISPGSLTSILHQMPGSSEGNTVIDIIVKDGSILPVSIRWQAIRYRGAVVLVAYAKRL